jgi:hypothetical protein
MDVGKGTKTDAASFAQLNIGFVLKLAFGALHFSGSPKKRRILNSNFPNNQEGELPAFILLYRRNTRKVKGIAARYKVSFVAAGRTSGTGP